MIATLLGIYLVTTFAALKCSYPLADKLLKVGAVVGVILLTRQFGTEIGMLLGIVILAYILKTLVWG